MGGISVTTVISQPPSSPNSPQQRWLMISGDFKRPKIRTTLNICLPFPKGEGTVDHDSFSSICLTKTVIQFPFHHPFYFFVCFLFPLAVFAHKYGLDAYCRGEVPFSTSLFFQIVFTLFTVKQYSLCLLLCICLFVIPVENLSLFVMR